MNVGYAHTIIIQYKIRVTVLGLQLILDYCTWLNGCALAPLCPSKHFLIDTTMLVHDMPFNLATLSMDQEVIILKQHLCILMPYKQ